MRACVIVCMSRARGRAVPCCPHAPSRSRIARAFFVVSADIYCPRRARNAIERLSSSYSRNWMPRLGTERMSVGWMPRKKRRRPPASSDDPDRTAPCSRTAPRLAPAAERRRRRSTFGHETARHDYVVGQARGRASIAHRRRFASASARAATDTSACARACRRRRRSRGQTGAAHRRRPWARGSWRSVRPKIEEPRRSSAAARRWKPSGHELWS